MLDKIQDFIDNTNKFPISNTGSFWATMHWNMWEPLAIQFSFLLIDYIRQKYIKKNRQQDLRETREEIHRQIEESKEEKK